MEGHNFHHRSPDLVAGKDMPAELVNQSFARQAVNALPAELIGA